MREKVLALIESESYVPMDLHELQIYFHKENDLDFMKLMVQLEEEHLVVRSKKNKYHSPSSLGICKGRLNVHSRGFAFLIDEKSDEEIFIPKNCVNGAMHNDLVLVRITKKATDQKPEGMVIEILERGLNRIVGEFCKSKRGCYVKSDDPKYPSRVDVNIHHTLGAMPGHKVVLEVTQFEPKMVGNVVKIIGHKNDPGVDILSIIERYDVDIEFPQEVYEQIETIGDTVDSRDFEGRKDFRDWQIVTIDGDDAKDLDDAISLTIDDNGHYHLGVHIADVSHYVQENTPLDKEAVSRGTSIYLVDRVIPMLPHKLSNGICSLNPNVDRLTLSCLMEVTKQGEVVDHEICASIINSKQRMTYNHVNEILEGNQERCEQYADFVELFQRMNELAHILRAKREAKGAIDFDAKEAKIIVDENGKAVDVVLRERADGEKLIEEFMLLANETVAEHFKWLELPYIYRIHEKPLGKKLQKLAMVLSPLGYTIHGTLGNIHPLELSRIMKESKDTPEHSLIATTMLRCMQKAKYSPECLGHFGLADEYYTHFTSPIRRYPDLLGHRIIHRFFIDGDTSEKAISHFENVLPLLAESSNNREVIAVDLERDVENMKKAEYMEDHIGEEYDGMISTITRFGFFVELDNTIDGLVHISEMKDDYYYFDEYNNRMVGERTGNIYQLCDKVKIRVLAADKMEGKIDFTIVKEKNRKKKKEKAKKVKVYQTNSQIFQEFYKRKKKGKRS